MQESQQLTQASLDNYKALYPDDRRLQNLTLEVLMQHTNGVEVDFNSLTFTGDSLLLQGSALDCGLAIGYVVFDCICLFLGASSLRSGVTKEAAESMAEASKPVASAIEKTIAELAKEGASTYEIASGVFSIISTIYSGGCLGAVLGAFLGSLTWYNAALYGVTAMATIVAALATDGAAEIALIVIELATAGFLVSDSANAVEACK